MGAKVREIKQPRAYRTRNRILRTARRLFALKGYHETKLAEVLRVARVSAGAFFHHFNSKEELGFAVIDFHMEERRRELQQIEKQMEKSPAEDDPLSQLLRRLDAVKALVRQVTQRKGGCPIGNLSLAFSDTHDAFRRRLAECFDEMALDFKPYLDAAVKRRRVGEQVDTWPLARYLVAMLQGSIMLARTRQDRQMLRHNVDYAKEYLKSVLRV